MGTRTLSWVSTRGVRKTLILEGTRRKPRLHSEVKAETLRDSLDSLDRFMAEQRARVAQNVQAMYLRLTTDSMSRTQRLTETTLTRRG